MEICKAERCTGCGVCVDACPRECISFRHDEHGFYRSYIDETACVNCHRCADVCPANHPHKSHPIEKAYKARRTDRQAATGSSSGGMASVLSEWIVKNGGLVAGCGFDENLCLKHSMAANLDELENFKGSKYLQSNTAGIYRQVREQLRTGCPVLFVGTPCQVAGLQNFLGKRYDNLFTVDFVCHGVASQTVFDKYLESLNPQSGPISVRFRNKKQGYRNKNACFEMEVVYPDQTVRDPLESGIYYWFSSSLSVRESCYQCPFVSAERPSDITLADYNGTDIDDADNEIGVNTLFVNSDRGAALLEAVKEDVFLEEKDVEQTVKRFDRLMYGSSKPACRKQFFEKLGTCDYQTLEKIFDAKKILPNKMVRRYWGLKRRIRNLLGG